MRLFEAQRLHAKRLGVWLSVILPRVRPGGWIISVGRSLLKERFAMLAARTLWWRGGVRCPMERLSPIGLPN